MSALSMVSAMVLGTTMVLRSGQYATEAYSFVTPKSSLAQQQQQLKQQQISSQTTTSSYWGIPPPLSPSSSSSSAVPSSIRTSNLFMKDEETSSGSAKKSKVKEPFSLSSLFGKSSSPASTTTTTKKPEKKKNGKKIESHPSQRKHISPLNLLGPDNTLQNNHNPESALPFHPSVKSGTLPNGLSYIILPNKSPANRFEAHLQVFSGSADELEPQQGIAHLTEHVAYMGSRKRERLFGTGSQTNAYTDFHHTVFYAACPTEMPNSGNGNNKKKATPMLPMALDALVDVMEARVESSRLEKERQAVLSEMTMVNTIEYRVECQILGTLHRENRLAKRFPIGKEVLIRSWTTDDVKTWHRTHYRPDNVLLYVVGDLDVSEVEKTIADTFGHLSAEKQGSEIRLKDLKPLASDLADAIVGKEDIVKSGQSWHYPPVRHDFCLSPEGDDENDTEQIKSQGLEIINKKRIPNDFEDDIIKKVKDYDLHLQEDYDLDDKVQFLKMDEVAKGKKIRPHIYRHELLQAFSLHLFAKRPVEPVVDMDSFRRSLARRIALAALQIRLNVGGRSDDPAFTFVEFNQLDSSREGCAVCSLDLTSEPIRWKEAICKSLSEIRKLGKYGVTAGEMERYASALMTDAEQLAAQGDRLSHGDQLSYLMETVANGHTFMSPMQSYQITAKALSTLTLQEVNDAAKQLCSHITSVNSDECASNGPIIATACSPKGFDEDDEEYVDEASLIQTIYEACQIPVEPEEDVVVPHTLIDDNELKEQMEERKPHWLGGSFSDGTPNTSPDKLTRPFTLRRLSNGIAVGISKNTGESQRGHLRLTAPGGRDAEKRLGFKSGSMAVGARCMQEGGAFGPWTREQVELFCVDHLLMVEINCNEESLMLDFVFPTTNVGNVGFGDDMQLGITGTEAVMQIVREIIVGFHWEEDALGRSKQSYRSAHETLQKNLEGRSTEMIMESITNKDDRFLSIDVETVNAVTLEDAKSAVMSQLIPSELEISVAGDFDVQEVLDMILKYIGTIPENANSKYRKTTSGEEEGVITPNTFGSVPNLPLPGKFLELELTDSDPRAVSYVAGAAPNQWGYLADGTTVSQRVMEADTKASDYDNRRRQHPLFGNVVLSLISEIANRRLFSTVRERKQLTYDANFSLTGFERLKGGWFLVTVTASKEKAQKALDACKETLEAMRKSNPISLDNLESAKRVVLNRHEGELRTSSYWAAIMTGIQQDSIPLKGPLSLTDYSAVVEAITTTDLQLALDCLGLDEDELYTAIGQTVQPEGYVPSEDEIVMASPMAGMKRGGALMN